MTKCKLCDNEVTCHGELCEECADKNLIKFIPGIEKLAKEAKQFRKEFPSLVGKDIPGWTYLHKDIQEGCIDKQKVKEVLNKHHWIVRDGFEIIDALNQIKKELGVEDK